MVVDHIEIGNDAQNALFFFCLDLCKGNSRRKVLPVRRRAKQLVLFESRPLDISRQISLRFPYFNERLRGDSAAPECLGMSQTIAGTRASKLAARLSIASGLRIQLFSSELLRPRTPAVLVKIPAFPVSRRSRIALSPISCNKAKQLKC
jgi:hypothetical protein